MHGDQSYFRQDVERQAEANDATIAFSSDYQTETIFWINTDSPVAQRSCAHTDKIGYLSYDPGFLSFAKPVTTLETSVPSGEEIVITGSGTEGNTSCGQLDKAFTPEKNKNYLIHFEKAGNYCRMNITEKESGAEVASRRVTTCSN
ncbi:hypothetical protein RHO15_04490 [Utexia brackfieldae]|uniref:hypothetical protein n=1 Tax=Utexia brackfieldae TaxID=3074108 RepID=UPI00370DCBD4